MSDFSQNQKLFASAFAKGSGLDPHVVLAWMTAEEPPGANAGYKGTQDWLNIGITDSGPLGAGNSVWKDPTVAGQKSADWMRGKWSDPGFGTASSGIQGIAKTVGQSPSAQLAAIANSGWSSDHYGGVGALQSLYNSVKSAVLPSISGGSSGSGSLKVPMVGGGPAITVPPTPGPSMFDVLAGLNQARLANSSQQGQQDPQAQMIQANWDDMAKLFTSQQAAQSAEQAALAKNAGTLSSSLGGRPAPQPQPGVKPGKNGLINPLHGFTGLSFDKGIDGSAPPGTPIRAPAGSTLVDVISDFYKGQPLLLFKFDNPIPGAPTQYWFTSEQINPATRKIGTHFAAGQPVATFASSGTGMETGWGDPNTSDRRFAPVEAHYGQAHTGWGWHFAQFFGVS